MTRPRVSRYDTAQSSRYRTHRPAPPAYVSLALTLVAPLVVLTVAYPLLSALVAVVAAVGLVGVKRT